MKKRERERGGLPWEGGGGGLVLLRLSKDGRLVRAPEPCLQPLDVTTRAAYGGAPTVSGAGCCDGRACVPRAQLVSCSDDCELRLWALVEVRPQRRSARAAPAMRGAPP
jgi:hypothetical protein